jgi:hypothetical protein
VTGSYLDFGDIEGEVDVLRIECARRQQGPLQRPQAD